jgi:hypothetical protein
MVAAMLVPGAGRAVAADSGLAAECARMHDDDTVHGYVPALHDELLRAFAQLFPSARMPPDEREIQAGAHVRCMDGRLLACFTGATLPCDKINTERYNSGALAYCHANRDAGGVPAFATGHDTLYAYRCVSGLPVVTGNRFTLDRRGFASSLWAPLD